MFRLWWATVCFFLPPLRRNWGRRRQAWTGTQLTSLGKSLISGVAWNSCSSSPLYCTKDELLLHWPLLVPDSSRLMFYHTVLWSMEMFLVVVICLLFFLSSSSSSFRLVICFDFLFSGFIFHHHVLTADRLYPNASLQNYLDLDFGLKLYSK